MAFAAWEPWAHGPNQKGYFSNLQRRYGKSSRLPLTTCTENESTSREVTDQLTLRVETTQRKALEEETKSPLNPCSFNHFSHFVDPASNPVSCSTYGVLHFPSLFYQLRVFQGIVLPRTNSQILPSWPTAAWHLRHQSIAWTFTGKWLKSGEEAHWQPSWYANQGHNWHKLWFKFLMFGKDWPISDRAYSIPWTCRSPGGPRLPGLQRYLLQRPKAC